MLSCTGEPRASEQPRGDECCPDPVFEPNFACPTKRFAASVLHSPVTPTSLFIMVENHERTAVRIPFSISWDATQALAVVELNEHIPRLVAPWVHEGPGAYVGLAKPAWIDLAPQHSALIHVQCAECAKHSDRWTVNLPVSSGSESRVCSYEVPEARFTGKIYRPNHVPSFAVQPYIHSLAPAAYKAAVYDHGTANRGLVRILSAFSTADQLAIVKPQLERSTDGTYRNFLLTLAAQIGDRDAQLEMERMLGASDPLTRETAKTMADYAYQARGANDWFCSVIARESANATTLSPKDEAPWWQNFIRKVLARCPPAGAPDEVLEIAGEEI